MLVNWDILVLMSVSILSSKPPSFSFFSALPVVEMIAALALIATAQLPRVEEAKAVVVMAGYVMDAGMTVVVSGGEGKEEGGWNAPAQPLICRSVLVADIHDNLGPTSLNQPLEMFELLLANLLNCHRVGALAH